MQFECINHIHFFVHFVLAFILIQFHFRIRFQGIFLFLIESCVVFPIALAMLLFYSFTVAAHRLVQQTHKIMCEIES